MKRHTAHLVPSFTSMGCASYRAKNRIILIIIIFIIFVVVTSNYYLSLHCIILIYLLTFIISQRLSAILLYNLWPYHFLYHAFFIDIFLIRIIVYVTFFICSVIIFSIPTFFFCFLFFFVYSSDVLYLFYVIVHVHNCLI